MVDIHVCTMKKNFSILFVSLGCDKNLVDSEMMIGLLQKRGYSFTDDETLADAVVINTCCFIGDAKEESINTILEYAEYRKTGQLKALIVTGCLAQRYQEEIRHEIEEVDAILGIASIDGIADALDSVLAGKSVTRFDSLDTKPLTGVDRVLTTGGHYAYLKIAEGCDKRCTYCIIPYIRGSYRSVPVESLVAEAGKLAEQGVKELILVAQETTLYGKDLYGKKSLPMLLEKLSAIDDLKWIRILYCYPEEIDDELIDAIKRLPKVCHYLDIPIQHGADSVLRRMGRRTTKAQLEETIAKLRREIPDICLRTTLITGFPGETPEDHEEVMYFVNEMEFDRLGVFPYSMEEDTPAALMEDQIPEQVKLDYRDEIMELQQEIAFEKAQTMIGRVVEAMIEGEMSRAMLEEQMSACESDEEQDRARMDFELDDRHVYVARTYMDAPAVDGFVFINTYRSLMSGDFVKVRITDSNEYDLIGEIEDEFTE